LRVPERTNDKNNSAWLGRKRNSQSKIRKKKKGRKLKGESLAPKRKGEARVELRLNIIGCLRKIFVSRNAILAEENISCVYPVWTRNQNGRQPVRRKAEHGLSLVLQSSCPGSDITGSDGVLKHLH